MRTLRPMVLAGLLLFLLPAPAARAEEGLEDLFRRAAKIAGARGPVSPAAAESVRSRLAEVPRAELPDGTWVDLHVLLAALDRRLEPMPATPPPGEWPLEAPPPDFPPEGLFDGDPDPIALLDVAAECRRRLPAAAAGAVPKPKRAAFARAAEALLDLARTAAAFESEDVVAHAAAAVLTDAARDLAFDLHCRSLGRAPVGAERFAWILQRSHGLTYGPDEVRAFGEAARDRLLAELEATAREIDPDRTWQELTEAARADRPASTEELLAFCETATREALEAAIASGLVAVPESARHPDLTLLEKVNPRFPTPYAHYRPRGRKGEVYRGTFVVTAVPEELPEREKVAFLRGRDHAWIRVICGHEAVPGHHLQYAHASGVESPWRRFGHTSVYVEGWGLYSEDLLARAGGLDTPELRLARLRMRLWRAVRVVVDVGMHTGELRPSEAVDMLVGTVLMDRWTAEREVSRYLVSPTQPLSYLVGYEKIRTIRRAWLARHGPDSEREFHDRLLALGPVPLDLAAAVLLGKRAAYDLSHP